METLCNLLYAKLGEVTTELLLYSRGLSVTLQETTNEHFESLSDICCFPLVERLYYCMIYCQPSFDIVVKLLTLSPLLIFLFFKESLVNVLLGSAIVFKLLLVSVLVSAVCVW